MNESAQKDRTAGIIGGNSYTVGQNIEKSPKRIKKSAT